ncbi:3-deoxy-D-manno-octulosonic acid transferase, partial [Vibrio parahaemolyticus]
NQLHPCLTQVLCQTDSDAERFERLGVNKEKLSVTGSIKFDIQISDHVKQQGKALRAQLGKDRPVWIAASTHKGEDEQVLEAHKQILESHPHALLILVPRHPERFDDVFALCKKQGFETVRRTEKQPAENTTQIYLGDTMGEMLVLIGAADICFMGGSLIGDKVGGHNVLEPAALGVPVITGPSYYNFQDLVDTMQREDCITLIYNARDLATSITLLMQGDYQHRRFRKYITKFVENNTGALKKTLRALKENS